MNSHFSAFIGYKPFFSMRYYMCYLEAQAVSTFDPKAIDIQKKRKPHSTLHQKLKLQKFAGCKNCTIWKCGGGEWETEKGFNGQWKRKDYRKGEERSEHIEEKRSLAVYKQNAFQERCRKFGTRTWNKIPSGTETERKGKERGRDEL